MTNMLNLIDKIDECDEEYYNNHNQIISDQEYDGLKDSLKHLVETFRPKTKKDEKLLARCLEALSRVGAPPPKDGKWEKVKLQQEMQSLNKCNLPEELEEWYNECGGGSLLVLDKLDGLSVSLQYDDGIFIQALSRGNGQFGENITRNVCKMQGVPAKLPISFTGYIRGEIVLKHSDWKKYFPEMSSARNAASGLTKRISGIGAEHLTVITYTVDGKDFNTEKEQLEFLNSLNLFVPKWKLVQNHSEATKLWNDYMSNIRETLDYDIDGMVVRINDLNKQIVLGERNHRPKGQIAFKFESPEARTTITDIVWQVGDTGRITPVAEFKPVFLLGAEIKRASLYNISYTEQLGVDIGAEVIIVRGNDVIPACKNVVKSTGSTISPPKTCPICEAKTIRNGEYLLCSNRNCYSQVLGRLNKWIGELNILEWGEAILKKLINAELVLDVADLYKLKVEDIENLERMGRKSAENLITELDKFREISLENFLGGLSIEGIATSSVKMIIEAGYDNLEKIQAMNVDDFININGFGEIKARFFYTGLKANKERIENILSAGVKIKEKIMGKLTNKSFCFTGKASMPRAKLEAMVVNAGGVVKSSVGKNLDYLVVEDPNGNSSKLQSARKNGTKLISELEFLEMCK